MVAEWIVRSDLGAFSSSCCAGALLKASVQQLLCDGAVAAAAEADSRAARITGQRGRGSQDVEAGSALANEELLAALLALDPRLAQARFRCVPSVTSEGHWWETYLRCLRAEAQLHLPALCLRAAAATSLASLAAMPASSPSGAEWGTLSALKVRHSHFFASAFAWIPSHPIPSRPIPSRFAAITCPSHPSPIPIVHRRPQSRRRPIAIPPDFPPTSLLPPSCLPPPPSYLPPTSLLLPSRCPQLPALLHLTGRLDSVSPLLHLAASCKALYALAHHPSVWHAAFKRDFPDLSPEIRALAADPAATAHGSPRMASPREVYQAVAAGRVGTVPAGVEWLVDVCLREGWGSAHVRYGGWGCPHLKLHPLRRSGSFIAVHAEFEYMFDDGDQVWGGRVGEELSCRVNAATGEWADPRSLHAGWPGLEGIHDMLAAFDPDRGIQPASEGGAAAGAEVELSNLPCV